MPLYEYRCAANGRTVEVRHAMSDTLSTWGEVSRMAGSDAGDTPESAPVERILSAPAAVSSAGQTDFQGCGSGCACAPSH